MSWRRYLEVHGAWSGCCLQKAVNIQRALVLLVYNTTNSWTKNECCKTWSTVETRRTIYHDYLFTLFISHIGTSIETWESRKWNDSIFVLLFFPKNCTTQYTLIIDHLDIHLINRLTVNRTNKRKKQRQQQRQLNEMECFFNEFKLGKV